MNSTLTWTAARGLLAPLAAGGSRGRGQRRTGGGRGLLTGSTTVERLEFELK
jgi:hypothetical protein